MPAARRRYSSRLSTASARWASTGTRIRRPGSLPESDVNPHKARAIALERHSDRHWLAVLAVDTAQGAAHLADGGVGAHRLHDRRHEVRVALLRLVLEATHRGGMGGGVALGTDADQARQVPSFLLLGHLEEG